MLLIYRAMIFNDPTIFEHHEMRSRVLALPNPPIKNFYPTASHPELRKLRNYQMYGLAWLESRVEHGGGIVGDHIGLGKVYFPDIIVCMMDLS
jgi:SNF2 family DNA or RNA helicase